MDEADPRQARMVSDQALGTGGLDLSRAPLFAILLGAGFRLLWVAFTNFTQEDAFIIFRFARQIAKGNGFVYNLGEPVYGSTSPLFTLLLAAWLSLIDSGITQGARAIDLVAALAGLVIVWLAVRRLRLPGREPTFVLATLAFSTQLWLLDTQGLETPLVLLFLAASWWMFAQGRPVWAGILGGALLWTRIDTGLWVLCMIATAWIAGRPREGLKIALSSGLTYLPWILFAWAYFGSPIPHTAVAKWVAYVSHDLLSLGEHALVVYRALKPFFVEGDLRPTGSVLTLATIAVGTWYALKQRKNPAILLVFLFATSEALRVILTRATSFSHYLAPALWATLILFGAGMGRLWDHRLRFRRWARTGLAVAILGIFILGLAQGARAALRVQDTQVFRHELALRAIGEWLARNTPVDATILAEPLGYIGYYGDRYMYDEVGLVTPRIVELKRQGLDAPDYIQALQPNYYVMHCDDALRWLAGDEPDMEFFVAHYTRRVAFNPVSFDPLATYEDPSYATFARNACYEVWQGPP